jgi:hypothetical protein
MKFTRRHASHRCAKSDVPGRRSEADQIKAHAIRIQCVTVHWYRNRLDTVTHRRPLAGAACRGLTTRCHDSSRAIDTERVVSAVERGGLTGGELAGVRLDAVSVWAARMPSASTDQ